MTKVRLRPQIIFAGDNLPTTKQIEAMHEEAHQSCFLANSVKTEVVVEVVEAKKITAVLTRVRDAGLQG